MTVSTHTATREAARHRNGRFGTQHRTEAATSPAPLAERVQEANFGEALATAVRRDPARTDQLSRQVLGTAAKTPRRRTADRTTAEAVDSECVWLESLAHRARAQTDEEAAQSSLDTVRSRRAFDQVLSQGPEMRGVTIKGSIEARTAVHQMADGGTDDQRLGS